MSLFLIDLQRACFYFALFFSFINVGIGLRKGKNFEMFAEILKGCIRLSIWVGRLGICSSIALFSKGTELLGVQLWPFVISMACWLGVEIVYWNLLRPDFDILPYSSSAGKMFIFGTLIQTVLFASIMLLQGGTLS